jgi:tRNA1Val (adenine37-N6)-methyltransferase
VGEKVMELKENERIDDLEYDNLKIIQNKKGFCFGIDSVLISDFARDIKTNTMGIDLGTGTGIISILLASKTKLSKILGIEKQKDIADMAKRSVELNKLQDKIEIKNIDIKDIIEKKVLEKEKFDFVVTNPPYKKENTGKTNESEYKYISRHETTAKLEDFIKTAKYLLKDRGSMYMVHRPDRLVDIIELMRKYKIEPKKIRFVYSNIEKEPTLILIKGIKNAMPFLKIEKPLIIYNSNGEYTDEIYKIYDKNK